MSNNRPVTLDGVHIMKVPLNAPLGSLVEVSPAQNVVAAYTRIAGVSR